MWRNNRKQNIIEIENKPQATNKKASNLAERYENLFEPNEKKIDFIGMKRVSSSMQWFVHSMKKTWILNMKQTLSSSSDNDRFSF